MIAYVTWFTKHGEQLAAKLARLSPDITYAEPCGYYGGRVVTGGLDMRTRDGRAMDEWLSEAFAKGLPIIIIGAVGIAVRVIAPFIESKISDSPVIVIDDAGRYVIPLLAGHLGGANELAGCIAEQLNDMAGYRAQPVITTSTDVNNVFVIDVFARRNGLRVCNADGIRRVSAGIISGRTITIAIDRDIAENFTEDFTECKGTAAMHNVRLAEWSQQNPTEHADVLITDNIALQNSVKNNSSCGCNGKQAADLILAPKTDVLGIGCRKNKSYEDIRRRIELACADGLTDMDNIYALASIDIKADEAGILEAAQIMRVPFAVYSAEELLRVPGDYTPSEFVAKTTGVDNVCERAAVAASGGGRLAVRKQAGDGITLAVAKRRCIKLRF